jgi:hypothetical protein
MEMVSKQSSPFMELRLQLEIELADLEEIEVELSELKQNSAPAATLFEKLTPDAATILSQLARQTQKIKNRLGGLGSHLRNYRKWKQENYYKYDLTDS